MRHLFIVASQAVSLVQQQHNGQSVAVEQAICNGSW